MVLALPAAAAVDVTTFGPKRYDRLKGAPTVYVETFPGCSAADHVLLQVWNGDSKATRITAAEVFVNDKEIFAENDFKKTDAYLERAISTKAINNLKITLKSGDFKEPSFLRISVISNGCDTIPPTIFDLTPVDTALLATSRPLISAAYSDGVDASAAGIDPAAVHLRLDGVAVTAAATLDSAGIRYLPPADLGDGLHTVTLEVADLAGNRSSRAWSFFLDTTPPVITVTAPADQSLSPVLNVQISGILSEAATLAIAGQPVSLTGTAFDHPLLLTPGPNTILLTADDAAGNRGSTTLTLWADNTPPVVTLTSPPDGLITNTPQLTISGTLSETATVALNGLSFPSVEESFSTFTTLVEGENSLTVSAVDLAGNSGSASVVVTLDTIAPQISITSPGAGSIRNSSEVTVNGSVSEVVELVTVNGLPVQLAGMTFTSALLTLPDGENSIEIVAVDHAGNRGTATLLLHVDTVAPVITIVTPAAGAIVNTPQISVSGSVNEADATLTINGSTVQMVNGAFSLTNFALHEGENLLVLSAVDLAGNRTSVTVPLTLDTVPPQINISAPLEQTFVNTPQISVNGTLSEEVAELTINGRSVIPAGTSFALTDLALLEGMYEIRITAVDRAGNSTTATRSITLDTMAPQLIITTPLAGTLLASATIDLQAHADELLTRAELNDTPAAVTGMTIAAPAFPLAEGENLLALVAFDRAGNRGAAQVTVVRDSTPPPAPLFTATLPLTRIPQLTLSGQAEAGASVTLMQADSGAPLAVVTADAQGAFAFPELTLTEGENRFSAVAVDAAANRSPQSELLLVTLDTIAPQIVVTAPLTGSIGNQRNVTVSGTLDDASATLTLNHQPVTLSGGAFTQPLELQLGSNILTLSAVDLAGNSSSIIVAVELDDVAPVITVTTPPDGLLTGESQVSVSGQISESHCTIELNSTALTVSGENFSGVVDLVEGENALTLTAIDRAGNRGTALLTVRSDRTPPTLGIVAPLTAVAGETVRVQITANDGSGLTLVETSVAGRPFAAVATPASPLEESLAYTLSPDLAPGTALLFALRGLDGAGNSATVTTTVTISAGPSGPGYLQGEVYDDNSGLRLTGVTVRVTSAGTTSEVVTAEDGGYLFELPAGDYTIELDRAGYTTAYRQMTIRPEQTITVLDARLTQLAVASPVGYSGRLLSAPLEAGPAWSGPGLPALTVALPEGALAESLDARLTALSNQGLPVPLPRGWSPLAALDLRFTAAGLPLPDALLFFYPATLRLPLGDSGLSGGDELVVARYDHASGVWMAQTTAIVTNDATAAVAALHREGIYALLIADPAPLTPPSPVNGEALAASTATGDEVTGWQTDGVVAPAAAPPSLGLRAIGEVRLQPGAELPAETMLASGLLLRGRVTESFNLFSGEVVQPADYVQDLLLYRAPCLSGAGFGRIAPALGEGLRTTFPVTPSHQYTIAELLQGEVGVSIVPPEVQQSGVLAGPDGALLLSSDGIALNLPAGALEKTVPVQLQSLAATAVAPLIPPGFTLVQALRIDLSRQTLQAGALLSLPLPAGFDASRPVVLAQLFAAGGGERLRGVAFLRPVGSLLTSVNSVSGVTLPGIRAGGTYCVLQSATPLGLVRGIVRNASNQPFGAALVTTTSPGLADLSTASGSYLLFTAIGAVEVSALDLTRFDRGASSGNLLAGESVLTLDPIIRPTVPSVVTLSPSNGATGVEPTTRISITFSEPVERSSISATSVTLSSSDNTPVAGVFSFSPDATVVSFYPETRLISEGHYRLDISSGVRDLQGYTLAAPLTATFIVRDTTPPPLPPAGSITATFPDEEGMITVTATRGSAEYDATILIINDTSGEIVSIAPHSDGSFSARIHGQLGDEIQIVMIDAAGNQTLISYLTFSAEDGRTLVTAKGGKVAGEGGLTLDIPAGALLGPAVVRITPVTQSELPHPVPAEAHFLGAVKIDNGHLPFAKEVELSIPLPADFPAGAFPFLAQPVIHTNPDGTTEEVYQLIDTVKIVDGRLTTASPPFSGVMSYGIFAFLYLPTPQIGPVVVSGVTYRDLNGQPGYQPNPNGGRETPTESLSGELLYNYDQPISGAVIRSPGGYNFIAYSDQSGHYAAFGFSVVDACRPFTVTAIHPQTMFRNTANLITCEVPHYVNNLNFKLADKGTTIPDSTAPVVSLGLKVVAGQSGTIVAGTVPIGTELEVPISVIDQDLSAAYLTVTFQTPEMPTAQEWPMGLDQSARTFSSPMQDEKPALFRYDYQPRFSAPVSGSTPLRFQPKTPGTYKIVVEAEDAAGLRTTRTVQVRAVNQGEQPASLDGPPQIDDILPANGAKEIMVTTPVIVTFSEPLDPTTVTTANLRLVDQVSDEDVPVYLYSSLEGGQMRVTLQPRRNLQYDHAYRVIVTTGIRDALATPEQGNVTLALESEVSADFTTKVPRAFDLEADSFSGSRDIDLYTGNDGHTYAYVAAGINGWRVIDVTDPTRPQVVQSVNFTATGRYFRGVAVEAEESILGLTEDIRALSGDQFGYVRFYDLAADPVAPPKFAQEKLAEAFSGIPGHLDLAGKYAYVATINAGIQVVDIEAAQNRIGASDGTSIVGGYDSVGQGYGHPNDVQVYARGKMLVTTNSGYLLLLSIAMPQLPTFTSAYPHDGLQATRAAAVSEYTYSDADGNPQTIDLAVIAGRDQLQTVDISDPYTPTYLGTAANLDGSSASVIASDITISKNAGLAFVSTFSEIQVFDIKDPRNPLLLQTITHLPGEDGNPLPIGMTNALVEKDGWVYLANQKDGMRVLDLDPVLLQQTCGEGESQSVRQVLCGDYYPALGEKTIYLMGRDWTWIGKLGAPAKLRVNNLEEVKQAGFDVVFKDGSEGFHDGIAKAYLRTNRNDPDQTIAIQFEVNPASLSGDWWDTNSVMSRIFSNNNSYKTTVKLNVRTNANVTLQQVLDGTAVYTYVATEPCAARNKGNTTGATPDTQGFDFVQMMINHILPPLRIPVDERNLENLLEVDGCYAGQTERALKAIINGSDDAASIRGNGYTTTGGATVLSTKVAHNRIVSDDRYWYGTFTKLKAYYAGLTNDDFGKVIDKELLVGFNQDLNTDKHPLNNADVGIYELYQNDDWDGDGVSNFIEVENSNQSVVFNPLSDEESQAALALKNTVERGYHHNGEMVKGDSKISSSALAGESSRSDGLRLPNSGKGFYYYRGSDTSDTDNYAILETLQKIEAVGRVWAERHPDTTPLIVKQIVNDGNYAGSDLGGSGGKRFGVGDISLPGGRQFCWAEGACHATHRAGIDFDVRYMSKEGYGDGGFNIATDSGKNMYDIDLTKELISWFAAVGADQIYVDQNGKDKIFSKTNTEGFEIPNVGEVVTFANGASVYVKRVEGHSDHFHVRFPLINPPVGNINLTSNLSSLPFNGTTRIESDTIRDMQGWPLLQGTQLVITATGQNTGTSIGTLEGEKIAGDGWTARRSPVDSDSRLFFNYSAGESSENAEIRVWVGDKNTGPRGQIGSMSVTIGQ